MIERSECQYTIDENTRRVQENRDYYKLRQQIIEHPFGALKRQWRFTYTLMNRDKVGIFSLFFVKRFNCCHRSHGLSVKLSIVQTIQSRKCGLCTN
jgi:hypothetical protein